MILIGNDIAPAVRFFINNRNLLKRIVRTSLMIFQEFVVISANHRSRFSFYGTLKEPAEKLDRFHSFQKIECSNIKRSILIGAEINSFRRDQNGGLNWITKMIQGKNHTSLKKTQTSTSISTWTNFSPQLGSWIRPRFKGLNISIELVCLTDCPVHEKIYLFFFTFYGNHLQLINSQVRGQ